MTSPALPPFLRGTLDWQAGRTADARDAFTRAAESGDPRGWFALGQLASEGSGEPSDPARAAQLYRRAADAGSGGAAHSLAALHALGRGVARDMAKALAWYRRGAELGDVESSFKIGLMLARGEVTAPTLEGFAEAEQRWRALAAEGHLGAIVWLGHLFSYLGPESSPTKACAFYLDALELPGADPAARREAQQFAEPLTSMLVIGAHTGDAEAAYQAGRWNALVKEPTLAQMYFELAANAGHARAQRALADITEDEARAIALYESAAIGNDARAQMRLGVRYAIGSGVPKDEERAVALLEAAAKQGNVDAMALVGEQLERIGRYEAARPWLVRAAERKHAGAMMAAANAFRDGRGGPRDVVQAVRWYLGLLEFGNGNGMHDAFQLAEEMTDDQRFQAAELIRNPAWAAALFTKSAD